MKKRFFGVWTACTTLRNFDTLDEAVKNADTLIKKYLEREPEGWYEDEGPRIYEYEYDHIAYDGDMPVYVGVHLVRGYTIEGKLHHDFSEGKTYDTNTLKGKILTWDDFRTMCREDASNWHNSGWTAEKIDESDILNEYSEEYWDEYKDWDEIDEICDYSTSNFFEPEDIAKKTIEYLKEIENEE